MLDAAGEAWGLELVEADRTGSRLDPDDRRAAVVAALEAGRHAAQRCDKVALDRLLEDHGVGLVPCDDSPLLGTLVRIVEYQPRPPLIRLFTRAVDRIAADAPELPVADIYIAHELFHHLETCAARPASDLARVTLARLGRWRWQSPVRALSEVAAHAFAQALLGSPGFPGVLDHLVDGRLSQPLRATLIPPALPSTAWRARGTSA